MQFDSFSEFLHMGGYAFYVWLAYGVTFVALVGIVTQSVLEHRNLLKSIVKEQARQERIKKSKTKSKQTLIDVSE
ncbi:heme exporter protein D [Alteromonas sp. KUL49]|nr:heme exporter protein CcmD [Alteromonas sp. KUL49]TAP34999.1 heme exporter protein CcmD [Alteromonas sp. KUL49]GEA13443.1 heme exporter protein D [Alteromonas sp. KUL49]